MPAKIRNKALDALKTLRANGAVSATFHPDGSLASVELGPLQVGAKSVKPVREIPFSAVVPPKTKTDLDALDGLPSFDEEVSGGN